MNGGDARDLARGLGDAVAHVDPATQVDDPHEDHEERDQGERELDEGLAAAGVTAASSRTIRGAT